MIEYLSKREGEIRLIFSNSFERDLFYRGLAKVEGIKEIAFKENTRSLKIRYMPNSFAGMILEHISPKKRESVSIEDLYFYLNHLVKHPGSKLLFSILVFGKKVGPIKFALCNLLIIPYLKSKF
ncbi:MAG: hypothetical protein ACK4GE_02440 [Caldimicrobium sp.]